MIKAAALALLAGGTVLPSFGVSAMNSAGVTSVQNDMLLLARRPAGGG
jgi:hypothetical protein